MTTFVGELLPAVAGGGELSTDAPDRLTPMVAGWLIASARSNDTLRAYRGDIQQWFGFCRHYGIEPLSAGMTHVDAWVLHLAQAPSARTNRPVSVATQARKVATVASFYSYLVEEGILEAVPVRQRSRPKAPRDSTTVGLSREEARRFMVRLALESTRDRAIVRTLLLQGLRVAELGSLSIGSMRFNAGHVTIIVEGKGRKRRELPLAAPVIEAVGEMLAERAALAGCEAADLPGNAPLFATAGGGRVSQQAVDRMIKRIAKAAGIPSWSKLSPHSMRHSCATLMLDEGRPLHVVQDHLGHASPETTRRYDRQRGALSRTPVHALAAYLEPERV